jgi:hypothetical protein
MKKFFTSLLEAIVSARMAKAEMLVKGYRGS